MTRPRLLDLFCGAGGAAMGYHRAGFDVVGVDIKPQPRYPFEFHQGDAMTWPLEGFDAIHASPPCQRWATAPETRRIGDGHPDLLTPTLERLRAQPLPWVVENIPTSPLPGSVLCGATFGLPIVRHRRFLTSFEPGLWPMACNAKRFGRAVDHGKRFAPYARKKWEARWRAEVLPVVWPWMTLVEAREAIPPAYTQYLGGLLLAELEGAKA